MQRYGKLAGLACAAVLASTAFTARGDELPLLAIVQYDEATGAVRVLV